MSDTDMKAPFAKGDRVVLNLSEHGWNGVHGTISRKPWYTTQSRNGKWPGWRFHVACDKEPGIAKWTVTVSERSLIREDAR